MFIQCLGTRSMSHSAPAFKHSRFGASLSRKAALLSCLSVLTLGTYAIAQSTPLKQIASIPDMPSTSKGAPASIITGVIVTNSEATGTAYVVNNDGSVLSIDSGIGRTPAADVLAHCSLILPQDGSAEHIEGSGMDGGAEAIALQDKIYRDAGRAGVQVLNVASANSCQMAAQISGTENVHPGLIAADAVANKVYVIETASRGSTDRVLILDGATDAAIASVNLDHSAHYSSIVVDSAGSSPTHLVFVSESDQNAGNLEQIWVIDPLSGSSLRIPGYAGRLFIVPATERGGAELVVAGDTTVNVFSIADISLAEPPPSPVSSGTYDVALLGGATQPLKNAVLSSPVLDAAHRVLFGNFNGSAQGDLPAQVLLAVNLDDLSVGANSKIAVGTSIGKLAGFDQTNISGAPIPYALAVDPGNELVYAIPVSRGSLSGALDTGANVLQAFRPSDGSVYTAVLTAPVTPGSTTGPRVPLAPSQIAVATDGKIYVAGASEDTVPARAIYSVAILEYSAASTTPAATVTTLKAAPTTVYHGQTVTYTATVTSTSGVPAGSVNFITGNKTLGTATLNSAGVATFSNDSGPIPGIGVYAAYQGNSNFNPSASSQISVHIEPIPTTTHLTTKTPAVFVGTEIFFKAVVTTSLGAGPTGIVGIVVDGVRAGDIATLNAGGGATLSAAYLTVGTHAIQAFYGGDSTHASSTSNAVTVTILVKPDFTVTSNPEMLTIAQGKAGVAILTVKSLGTYDAPVGLQCVAHPTNSTCKISKDIVTPTPGGVTTKLTITTNRSRIYSELQPNPPAKPGPSGPLTALAGSGFAGLVLLLALRGRKRLSGLRSWKSVLLGIVLIGTILSLTSSCGFQNPKTPTGSYSVKIKLIGASNNMEIEHTTVIQVSVSQ